MAKVLERDAGAKLYDEDFYSWAGRQAELLRTGRFADLDLDHLIEEVEDLAKRDKWFVENRLEVLLRHLLKLAFSPAGDPRRAWRLTVLEQRHRIRQRLSASLRRELEATWGGEYEVARLKAAIELERDRVVEEELPLACPWSLDQILDPDWWPGNAHGVDD